MLLEEKGCCENERQQKLDVAFALPVIGTVE